MMATSGIKKAYVPDLRHKATAFEVFVKHHLVERRDFMAPFEVHAIESNEVAFLGKWRSRGFRGYLLEKNLVFQCDFGLPSG
jgi:hypothetical protein